MALSMSLTVMPKFFKAIVVLATAAGSALAAKAVFVVVVSAVARFSLE